MPRALSAEQIFSYRANGFLHPLPALSAAEVARHRASLQSTEARLGGSLMTIDRKYRGNMHLLVRWVDEIARHAAILDAVEDLIGRDVLLFTSRFFIKEAHSQGIAAWHQDCTYFGLRPYDHVTAWVALSNVPIEAGPLEFAVGSHIRGPLMQRSNVVQNSVNTAGQAIVEWFDDSRTELAPLAAGEFSLHHTCVVHQSGPNACGERRIGLALSYIPTRTRHIGTRPMPASLVRGEDQFGHFDLQPRPLEDFGAAERASHDRAFAAYIESFYEQLALVEKDLPRDAARREARA